MEHNLYNLRFWYALTEHIVPLGTADEILQEVFSEMYPSYTIEHHIWGENHHNYHLTINFKEMTLEIVMIDSDGESLIPNTREILDDRFWTIELNEEVKLTIDD